MPTPFTARTSTIPPISLTQNAAYALAAFVVGISLFAAVTPSPLYPVYAELWGLSPLISTLVYATYAAGVLITLLFAGRASDQIGRRPVLLAALIALLASTVVFAFAAGPGWLFLARAIQGLATGAAISAASAALLDFHSRRDASGAGLANAVASSAGIALGIATTSVLVELRWAPLALPYIVLSALILIALIGVVLMPEPADRRQRLSLGFQRPHVPKVVRRPFLLASLTTVSSWSLGGLFFSLGPALGSELFNSTNAVVAAAGIVALAATATVSQLVFRRLSPRVSATAGSAALAIGVALIVTSVVLDAGAPYLVGSAVAGVGFGIGFLGGLRGLVTAIPGEHRASTMSAFYVVAYGALSIPAVLAGLVVERLGLHETFAAFGLVIAAISLVSAAVASTARRNRLGDPVDR